ncbi:methyltransferase-like protein 13 [Tanacetum coccineum]
MFRDESACNTYNYGDSIYWDARYVNEASFDWYQCYHALRPFVRKYIPLHSRVLMVGCGNAAMSEDMVKDGYESIMNVDISCVAIEMMRQKYEHIPQLKTLDSLMCGLNAPLSASQMLGEVSRILKPGGIYMLITYGDPNARMPHINRPVYNWKIDLYILPRPGFQRPAGSTSSPKSYMSPVTTTEKGLLPADYVLEDPDSHFIYICTKRSENSDLSDSPAISMTVDI